MRYERKIIYLDYFLQGERHSSAGFLKLEIRDQLLHINLQLRGLKREGNGTCKVFLQSRVDEQELCGIGMQQGEGNLVLQRLNLSDIAGTKIAYEDLLAIRIRLPGGGEACGRIREDMEKKEIPTEIADIPSEVELEVAEKPEEPEIVKDSGMHKEPETPQRIYEHKWKQLAAIYPHINPFQDEREYLSIGPQDFVILPDKFYRMANNSFLLHGYYNYKHLILKRMLYQGENRYYIGVPGTFYDREKQVAVMFGFENFECKKEPADPGDYGYYLMRVEM